MLTSQPHSYVDPQWNVVAALRTGAHLVLLDGFHPTTFMRDVARFGVTVFYCLGVMPTLLMKQPPADHDRNAAASGSSARRSRSTCTRRSRSAGECRGTRSSG